MKITPAFVLASLAFVTGSIAAPLHIEAPLDIDGPFRIETKPILTGTKLNTANTGKPDILIGTKTSKADVSVNGNSLLNLDGDGLGLDLSAILHKRNNPGSFVDPIPVVGPIASAVLPPVASAVANLPIVGGIVTGLTGAIDGLPVVGPIVKTVGNGLDLGPLFPGPQNAIVQLNAMLPSDATPEQWSAYIQSIQMQEVALQQKQQQALQLQAQAMQLAQQEPQQPAPPRSSSSPKPSRTIPDIQPVLGSQSFPFKSSSSCLKAAFPANGEWYYSAAALKAYLDNQSSYNGLNAMEGVMSASESAASSNAPGSASIRPKASASIADKPLNAVDALTTPIASTRTVSNVSSSGTPLSKSRVPTPNNAIDNTDPESMSDSDFSTITPSSTRTITMSLASSPTKAARLDAVSGSAAETADLDETMPSDSPASRNIDMERFNVFTVRHVLAAMPQETSNSTPSASSDAASPSVSADVAGYNNDEVKTGEKLNAMKADTEMDDTEDLDDCSDLEGQMIDAEVDDAGDKFLATKPQRDFRSITEKMKRWSF